MGDVAKMTGELVVLMNQIAGVEGVSETAWPELTVARMSTPQSRMPLHYKPSLCFVLQGQKRVFLGEQVFTYDPLHYLVVPMVLPLEMEVTQATLNRPMLGIALELDLMLLSELLISMDDLSTYPAENQPALSVSKTSSELQSALFRLLQMLDSPSDLQILGKTTVREILYWVLQGEQGEQLRRLVTRDSSSFRIANVVGFINQNFDRQININELSILANMSSSALHQKFRQVTCMSPLQYLKKIRLHNARSLMLEKGLKASDAAFKVGYTNPSQFSREFKRLFGLPPVSLRNSMK